MIPFRRSPAPRDRPVPPSVANLEQQRFLPGLHGLRALAALSVALFHQSPNLVVPQFAQWVPSYGGLGVQLFFVLSAFSLCHSTLHRTSQRDWIRPYAVKRLFRIAPMFYVGIALFSIYDRIVWGKIYTTSEYAINMLFVYNFVPGQHQSIVWAGWTIGVEMLFYAFFPLVISVVRSGGGAFIFFLLSCIASWSVNVQLTTAPGIPADYPYMCFVSALPSFSGGVLAFHVARALSAKRVSARHVGWTCGLLFCIVLAIQNFATVAFAGSVTTILWSVGFSILCVWQALAPGELMRSTPLTWIGERSYSIYLVHAVILFRLMPIYRLVYAIAHLQPGLAYLFCAIGGISVVLFLANLCYRYVEKPAIALGNRFERRSTQAAYSVEQDQLAGENA